MYNNNDYISNFMDLLIIIQLSNSDYTLYPKGVYYFNGATFEKAPVFKLDWENSIQVFYIKTLPLEYLCCMSAHERLCVIQRNWTYFTLFDLEFLQIYQELCDKNHDPLPGSWDTLWEMLLPMTYIPMVFSLYHPFSAISALCFYRRTSPKRYSFMGQFISIAFSYSDKFW